MRPASDWLARDEAELALIQAVVAFVAQKKVMPMGHDHRTDSAVATERTQELDVALAASTRLLGTHCRHQTDVTRRGQPLRIGVVSGPAIDKKSPATILDRITRQGDDSLD